MSRQSRRDDGHAFLGDPSQGDPAQASDELAESLAEEYLQNATSAHERTEEARDIFVSEEIGGPFLEIETRASLLDMDEVPLSKTVLRANGRNRKE